MQSAVKCMKQTNEDIRSSSEILYDIHRSYETINREDTKVFKAVLLNSFKTNVHVQM